jgi:ribonucleoside-diphosphate reductase alpha chain
MEAVEKRTEYNLINPHSHEVAGKANAREIFDKMVDMAWKGGDPGIIFIDRINRDNPTPHLGAIESTNPCGEQPLLPYESCNLGSINLTKALRRKNGGFEVDYPRLARIVKLAIRFLDDVIDVNQFPLPQIAERTRATRKIGLGVMGFADMLLQLGVPYNSEEALRLGGQLMQFIDEKALAASVQLAEGRGVFPAFQGSVYDSPGKPRVRNAARTTIAPTGTLSIIAACSSGIEPLFALSYMRNILDGESMVEVNPYFEQVARQRGFYSAELMQRLAAGGKLADMDGVPEDVKKVFVTAHDITPEWHVKMQAAFQRFTNNAVSKTVNFPHDATREDVSHVYMLAFKEGVKGITIYRDGSRDGQVLSVARKETAVEKESQIHRDDGTRTPRHRPPRTTAFVEKVTTGCGNIYVTVASDEQGICEVFSHLGKSGGCASAQLEATCRLISLALRSGVDISSIVKQLKGIRCPSPSWQEGRYILSCADAIGSVLEMHLKGDSPKAVTTKSAAGSAHRLAGQCPECGGLLIYQEGCHICPGCGYTKCG